MRSKHETIIPCIFTLYMHVLFCVGGNQMTASRIRGSKLIRSNAERGRDRLVLAPVIEDWHAKLLGVSTCIM